MRGLLEAADRLGCVQHRLRARLLVPLAGAITLVEQEGSPDHFLLDVPGPTG